ncbi:MAG: hypothetical protein AAGK17_05875 [Pseudomonadota bacterium]
MPEPILKAYEDGSVVEEIRSAGYAAYARTILNKNPGKTSAFSVPIVAHDVLRGCLTMVFFAEAHSMQDAINQYLEPTHALAKQIASRISR